MLLYELKQYSLGNKYIAGVDEVGRGCLAGPMVVCAVILNPEYLVALGTNEYTNNDVPLQKIHLYNQINDSKKLTPKKRQELSNFIREVALTFSITEISPQEIDKNGISKCTQLGFSTSVKNLTIAPHHTLTDAFKIKEMPANVQTNIVKGDQNSISIAAASILAKVYRDELMVRLCQTNPEYLKYGMDKHKGYGTAQHLKALQEFGPTTLHRHTFEPIRSRVIASS